MKSSFALLIVVCIAILMGSAPASTESGGVVRIHFSNSVDPDLSEIVDTFYGSGIIRAHLVIDSMPGGQVGAFHVGFNIESEDTSIVVLGGFHARPGWSLRDRGDSLRDTGTFKGDVTPASVGYWNLWLRNGDASLGHIELRPISGVGDVKIALLDGTGGVLSAVRSYHGGINAPPPLATDFQGATSLPAHEWDGMPQLFPVWVLGVNGDSARVEHNVFSDAAEKPKAFPVGFVRVGRTQLRSKTAARMNIVAPIAQIDVKPDGTVGSEKIRWASQDVTPSEDNRIGGSPTGRIALFRNSAGSEIRNRDGALASPLSKEIKWCLCFDVSERIFAVSAQDLTVGGKRVGLEKIMVLDYRGNILYDGSWTECEIGGGAMGWDPNVVQFSLSDCGRAGQYLLRVDEARVYDLSAFPRKGRRLSPDSRHILVNADGELSFYCTEDPESPGLLWRCYVDMTIRDVAVSNDAKYIAYRSSARSSEHTYIHVLSGANGRPLCRLLELRDKPAVGPLAFMGDYLFAGMGFGLVGTAWDTQYVYVFDLSECEE